MRYFKVVLLLLVIGILFVGVGGYYLLGTTSGSEFLFRQVLAHSQEFRAYGYREVEGTLLNTLTVHGLVIKDFAVFPAGNECAVEQLKISVPGLWSITEPVVTVIGGRLRLPDSEEMTFYGAFTQGILDGQISAPSLSLAPFRSLLPEFSPEFRRLHAQFKEGYVHLVGPMGKLRVEGHVFLQECTYRVFRLRNIPFVFDLTVMEKKGDQDIRGEVGFQGGTFSGEKGAVIHIQESAVVFQGEPSEARLAIKGESKINEYTIYADLSGSISRPELSFSSEPELSREEMLLLLATGQSFRSLKDIIKDNMRPYLE